MLAILHPNVARQDADHLCQALQQQGAEATVIESGEGLVLVFPQKAPRLDVEQLRANPLVRQVLCQHPAFLLGARAGQQQSTTVAFGAASVGGGRFCVIAGPCSIENPHMLADTAAAVKAAGASALRGGAFKPRTSPYSFQGLGAPALSMLATAGARSGLPTVSEVTTPAQIPQFVNAGIHLLQVGARNMQNYDLLRALGRLSTPVLLKRGRGATLDELLMSAEYILAGGNPNVILCERGIATFEHNTRSTLDVGGIAALKQLTHLPVMADPSHAAGREDLVLPLALAATAAGADGLLIEVHPNPAAAVTDGPQSITPQAFKVLMQKVEAVRAAL